MKTSYQDLLTKALDEMPNKFTSNQFISAAKKLGLPANQVQQGKIPPFLRKYNKKKGLRWWEKKNRIYTHEIKLDLYDLDTAIKILKSYNYKIMKPTTNWEEI